LISGPARRVVRAKGARLHDGRGQQAGASRLPHRDRGRRDRMTSLDLVVKNVRVVRPHQPTVERVDLGVKDGRFALVAPEIPAGHAREVFDGRGLLAFPGLVDAHTHVGIYAPLANDAVTESKAAAMAGSTDRYWCDYAYHLAPIEGLHL